MAGRGEVDRTVDVLTSSKVMDEGGDTCVADSSSSSPVPECAICLQSCVHPVRLPCSHVFCFLCVKGASWHSKRCALCRQEIPEDFLERPMLLSPEELKAAATGVSGGGGGGVGSGTHGGHAWYYEGRNGWWQYDERTSRELEEASAKGRKSTEMLIAGFLYVADLENMVQYRRNEHGRRRKIKRDVMGIPKKGVAGLRLDPEPVPLAVVATGTTERVSSADGADMAGQSLSAGIFGVLVPLPPVRPPTVLGGHLVSPPSLSPPSLEESLSQLLISQPEGEEVEGSDEGASSASQAYESASGSSEGEEEDGNDEARRGWLERERGEVGPRQRHQHRLLSRRLRETQPDRMPPGGGSSSSPLGTRSHSPDGQCTVTDV